MPWTMASIEALFRSEGRALITRTLQQGHVQGLAETTGPTFTLLRTTSSTSLLEDSLTENSLEDNRAGAMEKVCLPTGLQAAS